MKTCRSRELRHGLLRAAVLLLPVLASIGCTSAESGHAPGVAGGQTLTPGITNYPLAYVKRPVPVDDINVLDLITSTAGGDLYVRDQASAGGAETNVTKSITQGMGDVRDLDVSPDGTKLVFSLRLPLDPNKSNTDVTQPNWKLYQYDASTKVVTQLTTDDVTSGHDVGAHYLPDGRIVFSSTRQIGTQSILLDEGRPQYQAVTTLPNGDQQAIFLLHVMNADGTGMHQISFNTHHDFAPSVMNNGQIVFSRWEVTNGVNQVSLYHCNPDGTGLELFYGANSHATGASSAGPSTNVIQFLNARQRPDGKLIVIDRPFLGTQFGGDTLLIDAEDFVEITQPSSAAAASAAASGSTSGTTTTAAGTTNASGAAATPTPVGQTPATPLGVTTNANLPSQGGRFASAYPLYDGSNRMLVSWSPCVVLQGSSTQLCTAANSTGTTVTQAPPQYTLWVYDFTAGTLSPVLSAQAAIMTVEPVILQARTPAPTFIPDAVPADASGQDLVAANLGILQIGSVYDFDGVDAAVPNLVTQANPTQASYYARPARFIRIEKAVEIPGETVRKINASAFGPAGMGMREILAYAPIEPDGSARIEVPANVPFTIDILDANARRITAQHTSWLQLLPGETKSCNGCHSTVNHTSHGRAGLTIPVNKGAPSTGQGFPGANPTLVANAGETMAQTLTRISCETGSTLTCTQVPSTDVIYTNIWSTGVTPPAGAVDTSFSYTYAGIAGLSETPPLNANCVPWSAQCRVTIHYASAQSANQLYIQSVWNLATRTATVNGVANTSATCVTCHNSLSLVQVPPGQLDLTGGASNVDPTVVTSYEQLLFPHDEQVINMGALQNVPGPVVLAPTMTAGSAAGSTMFLRMFDGSYHDPKLDHTGFLTPAELRLISEWLDIGAQYYNDPFVAPVAN